MADFKARVKLGKNEIEISSGNFLELFEAVAQIEELQERTEGKNVRLIVRSVKPDKGASFKKYGFSDETHKILDLGMSTDSSRLVPLFGYAPNSEGYIGFRYFGKDEEVQVVQNPPKAQSLPESFALALMNAQWLISDEKTKLMNWFNSFEADAQDKILQEFLKGNDFAKWNEKTLNAVKKTIGNSEFTQRPTKQQQNGKKHFL